MTHISGIALQLTRNQTDTGILLFLSPHLASTRLATLMDLQLAWQHSTGEVERIAVVLDCTFSIFAVCYFQRETSTHPYS